MEGNFGSPVKVFPLLPRVCVQFPVTNPTHQLSCLPNYTYLPGSKVSTIKTFMFPNRVLSFRRFRVSFLSKRALIRGKGVPRQNLMLVYQYVNPLLLSSTPNSAHIFPYINCIAV